MALLNILIYPDEKLKQVSQPVEEFSEDLKKFIENLLFPDAWELRHLRWVDLKELCW